MPDSIPASLHQPPRIGDRIVAHPESAVAVASIATGAVLLVDAAHAGWDSSASLMGLPWWLLVLMGALLTIGGHLALRGELSPSRVRAWDVERAGWIILTGSWAFYAMCTVVTQPWLVIAPLVSLCLAACGIIRWVALARLSRAVSIIRRHQGRRGRASS